MPPRPRPAPFAVRLALAILTVAQFVASSGVPLPTVTLPKTADRPFPCMDRPCGCATYEKCWAGDCCCFTLSEKAAWAKARGLAVPVAEPPLDEPETCPRCIAKKKPLPTSVGWVSGVFAAKCHGDELGGHQLPVAVPPAESFRLALDADEIARVPLTDHIPVARVAPPDAPPPRAG